MTEVSVTFIKSNGDEVKTQTEVGVNVLQLAHELGLEMEGACEGNMACSTCHVVVDKEHFLTLPEASDEEEEMLDLAAGLKSTSRLGCQVIITEKQDGISFTLPKVSRNMMGF